MDFTRLTFFLSVGDGARCGGLWQLSERVLCPYGAKMLLVQWFSIGLHLFRCSWPAAPFSPPPPRCNQLTDAADQLPQHTAEGGRILESYVDAWAADTSSVAVHTAMYRKCRRNLWKAPAASWRKSYLCPTMLVIICPQWKVWVQFHFYIICFFFFLNMNTIFYDNEP